MYDADKPILISVVILIAGLVGLFSLGFLGGDSTTNGGVSGLTGLHTITIDGTPLRVEIADSEAERVQGLSGRATLPPDQGLLFVFEAAGRYAIWMRGMRFPLDVYWLNEQGVIVDAWKNAQPESYPDVFEPDADATYILEVVGGFSEVYNIDIGDRVEGLDRLGL